MSRGPATGRDRGGAVVRDRAGACSTARGRLRLAGSYEPQLLGSAGTVTANADLADDVGEVVIIYADNLSDVDLQPLLAYHRRHGGPLTMMLFRAPDPRACGIADLDARGRVVSFVEKPHRPTSDLANAGLYVVDAAAYREVAAMRAFDVLPQFVGRMRGWIRGGYHRDIGRPEALKAARRDAKAVFADRPASGPDGARPAVFLDRDGTLIEHVHYLSDPARVRLLPGAADALKRLRRAGFARVLVTNQSAIARGMITVERLAEIHAELERQLAASDATLDGIYYCPAAPAGDDRTVVECPDRKPGPGMLLRAASEMGLDLRASWMVGDLISDVLAGRNAGCRSIMVRSGQAPDSEVAAAATSGAAVVPDLAAAVDWILSCEKGSDSSNH
jgi:D-glycero-D-manno-heptose 1,7-bisphosphate phosphatase